MKKKLLLITAVTTTLVFALTACQQADVVGNAAKTSFDALVNNATVAVAADEQNNSWAITSPGGERFLLSKDFSGNPDVVMEFDAAPFINAGLDATKLPTDTYVYDQASNKLRVVSNLSDNKFTYKGEAKAIDSFNQLVETNREAIGYHAKLDHYGIAFGNGNMFEWAKDMSTNDKDMVFVLNPQPFIDAGVDPAKVTDWAFAKVEMMDENNKTMEVDKFLKPYELGK